jgi:hypothetical protein
MWSRTHSTTVRGLGAAQLWRVWTDVNQWHTWQPDIEYARLDGAFAAGRTFVLKPKGGPKVKIEIVAAEPGSRFTDLTRFPGARMYGNHEFVVRDDGLEIRTTIRVEGPLGFGWRKIVAEGIASGMAEQTERLLERPANA